MPEYPLIMPLMDSDDIPLRIGRETTDENQQCEAKGDINGTTVLSLISRRRSWVDYYDILVTMKLDPYLPDVNGASAYKLVAEDQRKLYSQMLKNHKNFTYNHPYHHSHY